MTPAFLALALALAAAPKPEGRKPDCGEMTCTLHATPGEALQEVLSAKPLILAIGEVHQTHETINVRSAISRFTEQMLPRLQHKGSDLIAETWISEGNCGEEETESVEQIDETTQRPAETEDELVTLLRRSKELGMLPHILEVTCEEYTKLLDADKELDAERLLKLVTKLLQEKVKDRFERNRARESKRIVVVYGGAIHNDVEPAEEVADFSFGKALDTLAEGRYVELDLYVPELIAADPEYAKEPWYPYFEKYGSTTRTLLIRPRPNAFIVVFPKSPAKAKPTPKPKK